MKSLVVARDPGILGATPVFVGTRVPVRNLLDCLEGGYTIRSLAATLHDLQRQKAAALAPAARHLIRTRSHDIREIEHALDHLLDCACIPEGLALFKSLCRHYYGINPANTASYVQAYREMWDTEAELADEILPESPKQGDTP